MLYRILIVAKICKEIKVVEESGQSRSKSLEAGAELIKIIDSSSLKEKCRYGVNQLFMRL